MPIGRRTSPDLSAARLTMTSPRECWRSNHASCRGPHGTILLHERQPIDIGDTETPTAAGAAASPTVATRRQSRDCCSTPSSPPIAASPEDSYVDEPVALVGFGTGIAFLIMGAWPVFGFCGLEVLLICVWVSGSTIAAAGCTSASASRRASSPSSATRSTARRDWTFQPYWLRVDFEEEESGRGELTLSSHGRTLVVGAFLSPDERIELADALRSELRKLREAPV